MPETLSSSPSNAEQQSAPANSKLSPAQQEFVRSPDFIAWFGDWQNDPQGESTSKMLDAETGEPQVFYHGTNRQFDISQPRDPHKKTLSNHGLSHDGEGIYVSDSEKLARQYADPVGNEFGDDARFFGRRFGVTTYTEVVAVRNEILRSCQQRDGRVVIKNLQGETFQLDEFDAMLQAGKIDHSDGVQFEGKPIGWVGEVLRQSGGSFVSPEDELVPYHSLYPEVEETLNKVEASGQERLLIPARAQSRVIPVFVKSCQPLETVLRANNGKAVDSAFSEGIDMIKSELVSGADAVVANGEHTQFGVNVMVFESEQLRETSA